MTSTKSIGALQIADNLLLKAQKEGKPMTNKKLQKLLYYVQAWSITIQDKQAFDEKIEAWIHGPAIRSVYFEYKKFGFNPIKKKITGDVTQGIDKETLNIIDSVWKLYGKFDSAYLEHLTHSEDPWINARQGLEADEGSDKEITFDSMKSFYSKKLKEANVGK